MRRLRTSALFLVVLAAFWIFGAAGLGPSHAAAQGRAQRAVALTFDDLPYVAINPDDDVARARRVTVDILGILRRHNILGNRTYSHADFNTLTTDQFEDEIVRGDVVTRRLMQLRRPYQLYFRHPETHTGDTVAKVRARDPLDPSPSRQRHHGGHAGRIAHGIRGARVSVYRP